MRKALVLGCGPAGLLVTHALELHDVSVTIISKKDPSFISGAQYLHSAIPELTDIEPPRQVTYAKVGNAEGYAAKIYGDALAPTSWGRYEEGPHGAWPLEGTYHQLWNKYEDRIIDGEVLDTMLERALQEYDVVCSTIPLRVLFPRANYSAQAVLIVQEAEDYSEDTLDYIVYNGVPEIPWYRTSRLWDHVSTEYPILGSRIPAKSGMRLVQKPLTNDVSNPYSNLFLMGRYGKWDKNQLTDDAFREAMEVGEALQ